MRVFIVLFCSAIHWNLSLTLLWSECCVIAYRLLSALLLQPGVGGQGGPCPPPPTPLFDRSVLPISTRGDTLFPPSTICPTGFSDVAMALKCKISDGFLCVFCFVRATRSVKVRFRPRQEAWTLGCRKPKKFFGKYGWLNPLSVFK